MKKQLALLGIVAVIALSGCGNNANNGNTAESNQPNTNNSDMSHSEMNHSGTGEVPEGLKEAANPKFKVGSEAIIKADHMEGMDGATATIVGAYDTTVYAVSYTPTTGGERVTNHKWVIHQEIKDAGEKPFEQGTEVVLQADHMKGMDGATATIDSAQQMTIYMVDYFPTNSDKKVTNHQWVTEDELTEK
ncbi:YdhK family protein [Paenibacillus cisolokensis]|uniref:YdhK family protein n=1 Tax=Paenibacillus cisolokensis TaxID=1658519 RepID=UPI003D2CAC4E